MESKQQSQDFPPTLTTSQGKDDIVSIANSNMSQASGKSIFFLLKHKQNFSGGKEGKMGHIFLPELLLLHECSRTIRKTPPPSPGLNCSNYFCLSSLAVFLLKYQSVLLG